MTANENAALLEELRARIRNGDTAVKAMRILIERLHLGPESRLIVIEHFRQAFGIDLRDAAKLGAWEFFSGGGWSEKAVDEAVTPVLLRRVEIK